MIDLYCSSDGTGNGLDPETPASLPDIKTIVCAFILAGMTDNITVWLAGEVYNLVTDGGITLSDLDSANNGYTIRWRCLPADLIAKNKPIFDGGLLITGWTLHDEALNIWVADVPAGTITRQLFVDGERAPRTRLALNMSRWAEGNDDAVGEWGKYYVNDPSLPEFTTLSPMEFVFVRLTTTSLSIHTVWYQSFLLCTAASRIGDVTTFTKHGAHTSAEYYGESALWEQGLWGPPTYLENAYELLQNPGEWFLDETNDKLYYIPLVGVDIATSEIFIPVLQSVVTGSADNLKFEDIVYRNTGWTRPSTLGVFNTGGMNLYWEFTGNPDSGNARRIPAAIDLARPQNVKHERCVIRNTGGTGLYYGFGSKNCLLQGSYLYDIAADGAQVGTHTDESQNNGPYPVGTWEADCPEIDRTVDNTVRSCKIQRPSIEYLGGQGITGWAGINHRFIYNEIWDTPYSAIVTTNAVFLIRGYASGAEVAHNFMHDILTILSDGGCVRVFGPYPAWWHHNITKNCGNYGRSIYRAAFQLYVDNHAQEVLVESNVALAGDGYPLDYATHGATWAFVNGAGTVNTTGVQVEIRNNYAQTDFDHYIQVGDSSDQPDATISNTTYISGNPASWPIVVTQIVSEAKPEKLIFGDIIEGTLTVYGWRDTVDEHIELTLPEGVAQLWYAEPYDDTWVAELDGVTTENVGGISLATSPATTTTISGLPVTLKTLSGLTIIPRYRVGGAWQ